MNQANESICLLLSLIRVPVNVESLIFLN